jgi:hypothetical protein
MLVFDCTEQPLKFIFGAPFNVNAEVETACPSASVSMHGFIDDVPATASDEALTVSVLTPSSCETEVGTVPVTVPET